MIARQHAAARTVGVKCTNAGPWRNLQAVEMATLEWVDWFNNRRLFGPIGNIPPVEAEAAYYPTDCGFRSLANR
jgi:transposase InsO family protein